jgi:hypothetical protein
MAAHVVTDVLCHSELGYSWPSDAQETVLGVTGESQISPRDSARDVLA